MDLLQTCFNFPNLLDEIFTSIKHAVLVINTDGHILITNPVVEKVLGFAPRELEFQEFSVVFTPEDLNILYPNLLYLARKRRPFEGEAMLKRKDETRFFAYLSLLPFMEAERQSPIVVVTIQDIDRLKTLERSARDGRYYSDIESLAGGLAHQIRNPLVEIYMSVKRIFEPNYQVQGDDPNYNRIMRELKRIETMTRKFEHLFALPRLKMTRESTAGLVAETVESFRERLDKAGIALENRVEDQTLLLDRNLFIKAVSALIQNAMEAIPGAGGMIVVSSEVRENIYRLSVRDDGAGISEGDLNRLLGPFFTTKPGGVGLDITMIRKIMELHDGDMEIHSEPGAGAEFVLLFPWERRRFIRNWRLDD